MVPPDSLCPRRESVVKWARLANDSWKEGESMGNAKVTFTRCVLGGGGFAPERGEARGEVYFIVEHEGKRIEDSAEFRRRTGPKLESRDVDIMFPKKATFLNQEDFAVKARDYIHDLVMAEGAPVGDAARPGGISGTDDVRRWEIGNTYARDVTVEVAVSEAVPMQPVELA
jgi:hypothetical protein